MAGLRVAADRAMAAPPAAAWGVLADYGEGHPSILPRPWFRGLDVVEGGRGAGTVIDVHSVEWGRVRTTRMVVEEPDPGRVLLETAPATGVRTTFTVTPEGGGCRVEIATEWPGRAGLGWRLERWMLARFAPRVFAAELDLLAAKVGAGDSIST